MRQVTCIYPGVFERALSMGTMYHVLDFDPDKRQLRIKGDNGRERWYPLYCFQPGQIEAPRLTGHSVEDPIRDPKCDAVDVRLQFDRGGERWCIFMTPAYVQRILEKGGGGPCVGTRHMIVLPKLSLEAIEQTLRSLDAVGVLPDCSLAV